MIDETVEILQAIKPQSRGIRELAETLHHRPATVIATLRRMEDQGLITFESQASCGKGRPKKIPQITDLGEAYLMRATEVQRTMLKARQTDFDSVVTDLERKQRLIERGSHPHTLFVELRETLVAIRDAN